MGVCHSDPPFSSSASHLLYPLGEYTSFILVSDSFRVLRQRWVIPLPPLQNPAFTNPDSFFSRIQTVFIRFSSLEFFGNCRLGNVVFFGYPKMLLVTRTRDSEFYGRDTHPSLSLLAPSPLVRVPFFRINIHFTRPRPCLEKGERCFRPTSFSMGLLA